VARFEDASGIFVADNHEHDAIPTPNPAEAITAFAAWLTTRRATLVIGANHDAAEMAMLVGQFIDSQRWRRPRDGWENALQPYPLV
jgi:hypothetical protein